MLAIVGGAWAYHTRKPDEIPDRVLSSAQWNGLRAGGAVLAGRNSPVRIVEFSDFQCPFCAQEAHVLEAFIEGHPNVGVRYRQFPLSNIHLFAREMAIAAVCADRQGRFAPMHSTVFANQALIGTVDVDSFAVLAGVRDRKAFQRCTHDATASQLVEQDAALGRSYRLTGTPALVVDGRLYVGGLTLPTLEGLLDRDAKGAELQ
jgi:protein-disulfide isomerase